MVVIFVIVSGVAVAVSGVAVFAVFVSMTVDTAKQLLI